MAQRTAHSISVRRTARYYTAGSGAAPEVWLVGHGYGQLAGRFIRHFEPLAGPGRLVIAPEGLSRFYLDSRYERVGASWMTRDDREAEIADQIRFLDAVWAEATADVPADARVVVLGFSQGCATVTRWLAQSEHADHRPRRADRLVLWGGALPHDLDLKAHGPWLAAADLTLVAGDRDEYATPGRVRAEEARLQQAGVPHRVVSFAGGHRLNARVLGELARDRRP